MLPCACDVCVTFETLSETLSADQVSENARKRPDLTMAVIDLAERSSSLENYPDSAELSFWIDELSVDVLGFP
jgi:hypothetical protein